MPQASASSTAATLLMVAMAAGYVAFGYGHAYVSCRDSRIRCLDDPACKHLIGQIEELCGESADICPPDSQAECRRLLLAMQLHPIFKSCSCNLGEHDAIGCFSVRNTIFLHSCVTGDARNLSSIQPTSLRQQQRRRRRQQQQRQQQQQQQQQGEIFSDSPEDDDDADSLDGGSEEGERDSPSCIGVRGRCLRDDQCNGLLTSYRDQCRENKKQNECVATDWYGCHRAMNSLQATKPELFDCACPMKRHETKNRCERIQWRISNNTCLVTIPYLISTLQYPEFSYKELSNAAYKETDISSNEEEPVEGVGCTEAFRECDSDSNCRSRLSRLVTDCALETYNDASSSSSSSSSVPQTPRNATRCDRRACRDAVGEFFAAVAPRRTQRLLFCRCPSSTGDGRCETLRRALSPPCSVVELPPPTCLDLVSRCLLDFECRPRWKNYDRYCYWNETTAACHSGPDMCRSSIVAIAATDLTINCTCALPFSDPDQQQRCEELRSRLRLSNRCIDMAIEIFHKMQQKPTTATTTTTTTTTTIGTKIKTMLTTTTKTTTKAMEGNIVEYSSDSASQSETSHVSLLPDCGRHFGEKIPSFMTIPEVLRIYTNQSDCSEVCRCHGDRSVSCKVLPCLPNKPCKLRDRIYEHGASFLFDERGQCRCIRGELVCAKSQIRTEPSQGLFLHLGYSVSDQHLIETNTRVRFSVERVASKLATLLNEDSAEQFCQLRLRNEFEGNLLFQIELSQFSPSKSSNSIESCLSPANSLSSAISNRMFAVISDAELSIIKVAQVERVKFHEPSPATSDEWRETVGRSSATGSTHRSHHHHHRRRRRRHDHQQTFKIPFHCALQLLLVYLAICASKLEIQIQDPMMAEILLL